MQLCYSQEKVADQPAQFLQKESAMQTHCTYVSYAQTHAFKPLITDYLAQAPSLQSFFSHSPSLQGIRNAIAQRSQFSTNRPLLVQQLQQQYQGLTLSAAQLNHLDMLHHEHTFTITTAHQPNLFTGPLYFLYKIAHTIQLCKQLQQELPENHFVPIYYMGSEDADLEELGHCTIGSKTYTWHTQQTGAVGRMLVDKALLKLIHEMELQIAVLPHGMQVITLFKQCYTLGKSIQQATLELVHALFGHYGLLVLIPDNAALKKQFEPIVAKELQTRFSHLAVTQTIQQLGKLYKVQAAGRDINLFYLSANHRERIVLSPQGLFEVKALQKQWTEAEILTELAEHPENFSANVILRGLFQETILPNIAFIGGGGELAYWLELKEVFAQAEVPYPVLILRNSFLFIPAKQQQLVQKLGLSVHTLFNQANTIINQLVVQESEQPVMLAPQKAQATALFSDIASTASAIDSTLFAHTISLQKKLLYKLAQLEKKMLRAQKRKFSDTEQQVVHLKNTLFPNNNLQERVENFAGWYAQYGDDWFNCMLQYSQGLEQQFGVVSLS